MLLACCMVSLKARMVHHTCTCACTCCKHTAHDPPFPYITQARQLMVDLGVSPDNIFLVNLADDDPSSAAAFKVAVQGCEAMVICTSAVPQPQILATLVGGVGHWFRQTLARKASADPFVPVATWKGGQTPQQVRQALHPREPAFAVQHTALLCMHACSTCDSARDLLQGTISSVPSLVWSGSRAYIRRHQHPATTPA